MKLAGLLSLWCVSAFAQSSLEQKVQAATAGRAAWLTYTVPLRSGAGSVCGNWNGDLQFRRNKVLLEGPRELRVLLHWQGGKVEKLLLASEDCAVSAGSQELLTLADVSTRESIDFLAARGEDTALLAISLHDDPAATARLIALAKDPRDPSRRRKAFFWLARSKDPAAIAFLDDILR